MSRKELLIPYLVLVSIHFLSSLGMEQPIVLADELGYLGNARYLAGVASVPDMQGCNFYHFGYSLLVLPAFWLFSEPTAIYQAVVTFNAFLAAALFFPLFSLLSLFADSPRTARWVAFACCLYPPLVLYSNLALSENAFVPVYAAAVAFAARLLASRSFADAALLGFFAGFLYTVHPRALPVIAAVTVYLLLLAAFRVLAPSRAGLSLAVMGAILGITRTVNESLKSLGWESSGEFSPTKLAGRVLPGSNLWMLLERAFGQALYLIQASHGLVLLGLAVALGMIFKTLRSGEAKRTLADPAVGALIFAGLTAGGIFFASATSTVYSIHGPDGVQGANLIHGRHNEAFAVLLMGLALTELCRRRWAWKTLVGSVVALIAVMFLLTAVVMPEVNDARIRHVAGIPGVEPDERLFPNDVDAVNVVGIYPLVEWVGALDLYPISAMITVSLIVLFLVLRATPRGGLALLMLFFGLFAWDNDRRHLQPAREAAAPRLVFANEIARLNPVPVISYDRVYRDPDFYFGMQYLMPQTRFVRFNSRRQEKPRSEAVISLSDWTPANDVRARFAVASGAGDNVLWLLPGEMRERMPTMSYDGVNLGATPIFGVQENGFYEQTSYDDAPARWTNGEAMLRILVRRKDFPSMLEIETVAPGGTTVPLQVLANGIELWNAPVPPRWSNTLSLRDVPWRNGLVVRLNSSTFSPQENLESTDERELGVMVRGLRLRSTAALTYDQAVLGGQHVFGFPDNGFYPSEDFGGRPGRWTNGAATLTVPLDPESPPRQLEIETIAPSRQEATLQVLVNGTELWNQAIPTDGWTQSFSLEQVPMTEELVVELRSDTFSPPGDSRQLGIVLRSMKLSGL